MIHRYVTGLHEVDGTWAAVVGGKAARLGELMRIEGLHIPGGFCVTTGVFRRIMAEVPSVDGLLDHLSLPDPDDPDDREAVSARSAEIRRLIEEATVPDDVLAAISTALATRGGDAAYAVRSSATAEDLSTASFAGQLDTFLNVIGPDAVVQHIRRCWASLFTERAVVYRRRNGIDHRQVEMAVIVQPMVRPRAAGVLFTADPVTSDRRVASVEAAFGLGEAMVAGTVNTDIYKVRADEVVARTIATKPHATHPSPAGGTREVAVDPEERDRPVLTDAQVVQLTRLGRRIEEHFGHPQDIEWCLDDDGFQIVQSRPVTTLFPVPETADDDRHVYVSVGHQQMMTDPMKPLGLSLWLMTALRPMHEAGGRLFVDVARELASPTGRAAMVGALGRSDPLIGDALQTIVDRGDVVTPLPDADADGNRLLPGSVPTPLETDPAVVTELVARSEASIAALEHNIRGRTGPALLDFISDDVRELQRMLGDPLSLQVIMAGMEAMWWLNDQVETWLGERNVADVLVRSAPGNVTAEMGLALLDVGDVIRPHDRVVAFLQEIGPDDDFLDGLEELPGGRTARDAIGTWLDRYGMRCVGEIDITRPRWSERPATLVPVILGNIRNFRPGESRRRFEKGREEASRKEHELRERLRALPDGEHKAGETARMIDRARTFVGYREYPKYAWIRYYFVYKQALMAEAERLVRAGVLETREAVFDLTFPEFHDVVRTHQVDQELIRQRRDRYRTYQTLTPPRVITSDGEVVTGSYRRDGVPAGALVGLPVSSGCVEGRARIILDLAQADLEPGDILVTTHTDPSWTPLFVTVAGLVTEVGGLMTHGAVVAREYGLPAVVGVEDATGRIPDGQRIRIHGTDGYVELLSD